MMRPIHIFLALLLLSAAIFAANPDAYDSGTFTYTTANGSIWTPKVLGPAITTDVWALIINGTGSNSNTNQVNSPAVCTNLSVNFTNTCGNVYALDSVGFNLPESQAFSNTSYNATINVTNSSLNLTLTNNSLEVDIYAGYFTSNTSAGSNISIYLWNSTAWVFEGNVSNNAYGWSNFTGLNRSYAQINTTSILFNHSGTYNVSNPGLSVDYINLQATQNSTNVTNLANVSMQGSLDTTNWFSVDSVAGQTNNTIRVAPSSSIFRYVRFIIGNLTLGNTTDNFLTIENLGLGR